MTPLADGSDMGGSLRNPPSFCGVVGIRLSPGRVPNTPSRLGWQTLSVAGPVARNVSDCAFFLSVLAGFDRRSPIALDRPGRDFAQELGRSFRGVRVAFFKDLGLPWDSQVKAAVTSQRKVFESLGCIVEEAEPDFRDANECFLAWRHWSVELTFGDILESKGDQLNEYVHWHVEEGRKLTGPYLARIEAKRTALYERFRTFMEKYEFFVLPVNQVLPFDANVHYPTEIAGVKMESYMAWMKSAYYISAVGNPAVSVRAHIRRRACRSGCRSSAGITMIGCPTDGVCVRASLQSAKAKAKCHGIGLRLGCARRKRQENGADYCWKKRVRRRLGMDCRSSRVRKSMVRNSRSMAGGPQRRAETSR